MKIENICINVNLKKNRKTTFVVETKFLSILSNSIFHPQRSRVKKKIDKSFKLLFKICAN